MAELEAAAPRYGWKQFLDGEGVGQVKTLNVAPPEYVKTVNGLLQAESLGAIKNYMRWKALHAAAPLPSDAFFDENFNFLSAMLNGQQESSPRWERCTAATDGALGEAVGQTCHDW